MGTDASILIHEVLVAMSMRKDIKKGVKEGSIDDIIKTIHIHPALSEVIGRAASML